MKSIFFLSFLISCVDSTSQTQDETSLSLTPERQLQKERVQPKHDPSFEDRYAKEQQFKRTLYASAPSAAQKLIPLLSAHHSKDLPNKETLNTHEQAEEGLLWIAQSEYSVGIRSRAISFLRFYDSSESRSLLLSTAESESEPALLRAAALNVIAKWSVESRAEQVEIISQALEAEEPVVVIAAINASRSLSELDEKVSTVQREHPSPIVRESFP